MRSVQALNVIPSHFVQERLLKAQGGLAEKQPKAAIYDDQKKIPKQWSYRLGKAH
jgi:hypothetical protein